MRRRTAITALLTADALGGSATGAVAFNTGEQPPGPPQVSGGYGAAVLHCASITGTGGVVVLNRNGIEGTGICFH